MEGQCNRHFLHFYVLYQYFLHNHQSHFEAIQIYVSENHVSYHFYHRRSLAYLYLEVVLILHWFLFHQCYYTLFIFYFDCMVLELFYSLWLKFLKFSFFLFSRDTFSVRWHSHYTCSMYRHTWNTSIFTYYFFSKTYSVGYCSLIFLSSELADDIDIF